MTSCLDARPSLRESVNHFPLYVLLDDCSPLKAILVHKTGTKTTVSCITLFSSPYMPSYCKVFRLKGLSHTSILVYSFLIPVTFGTNIPFLSFGHLGSEGDMARSCTCIHFAKSHFVLWHSDCSVFHCKLFPLSYWMFGSAHVHVYASMCVIKILFTHNWYYMYRVLHKKLNIAVLVSCTLYIHVHVYARTSISLV